MARRGRYVTYVADLDLNDLINKLWTETENYGQVEHVDWKAGKKGVKLYITIYTDEKTPKALELKPEITIWAWREGK